MGTNYNRYVNSTRANFSAEDLRKAQENLAYGARRFPEEHARAMALIKERGLEGHREITEHYSRFKMPMSESEIKTIALFADTTYKGAFNRGEAHEAPTTAGGTKEDNIFRPAVAPEGQ
ncbi:hypothetical protein [Rhizobium sp. BK060]|uniref:hypothetical protein n=1 Tax=Rhizobium sp. BK060 TaxID=2587096 RepID=UPI00160E8E7A|nr:hypothetical protein [Rhizobium sp. BK060]MBB3394470.1 hypothetical protein [Rhizobium sp. BK060]